MEHYSVYLKAGEIKSVPCKEGILGDLVGGTDWLAWETQQNALSKQTKGVTECEWHPLSLSKLNQLSKFQFLLVYPFLVRQLWCSFLTQAYFPRFPSFSFRFDICLFHFPSDIWNKDLIPSCIPFLVCFVSCINGAEGLLIIFTLRDIYINLLPIIIFKG